VCTIIIFFSVYYCCMDFPIPSLSAFLARKTSSIHILMHCFLSFSLSLFLSFSRYFSLFLSLPILPLPLSSSLFRSLSPAFSRCLSPASRLAPSSPPPLQILSPCPFLLYGSPLYFPISASPIVFSHPPSPSMSSSFCECECACECACACACA